MRVAVDVSQTCGERAGCAWLADSFARALAAELGPENIVLYHHFGAWTNRSASRGTRIEGAAAPFLHDSRERAMQRWARIQSGDEPMPGAPDIVHSFSFMAPTLPKAQLAYTIHDLCFWTHPSFSTEPNRLLCQQQALRALDRARALFFVSEQSRKDFESLFPGLIESKKLSCSLLEPVSRITPSEGEPEPLPRNAHWIHIGTIEPRKGIEELLSEYLLYYEQSLDKRPLVLVGGAGWKSEELLSKFDSLRQDYPIRYIGYAEDAVLQRELRSCFGLISLSHYEGFGLPVLEAATIGKPVVCNCPPSFERFRKGIEHYHAQMPAHQRMLALEASPELHASVARQSARIASERKSTWMLDSLSLYQRLLAGK